MTPLTRKVVRQTSEVEPRSRRPLVIELTEGGRLVRIREKGRRKFYSVTYHDIFMLGARNKAIEIKNAKLLAKQQRKTNMRSARG